MDIDQSGQRFRICTIGTVDVCVLLAGSSPRVASRHGHSHSKVSIPKTMKIARQPQLAGGRAKRNAERNHRIGHAAALRRHLFGNDLGGAGKGDAFTDSKHDAQHEQREETAGKAHQQGGHSPDQQAGGHQPVDREAIDHPTNNQLHGPVDPEEGGGDQSESGGAELKVALHQRCGNADGPAVDVIEEDRRPEQQDERIAGRSLPCRSRHPRLLLFGPRTRPSSPPLAGR
jgi:hypothetical protein